MKKWFIKFTSETKDSLRSQACVKGIPEWRPIETLGGAVTMKPELPWRLQEVRDFIYVGYLPRKLLIESGTLPRERSVLQLAKLKGFGSKEHF